MNLTNIDPSWKKALQPEFDKEYFINLDHFLKEQRKLEKQIYPKDEDFFSAINLTSLEKTRVIIIGQDPYHGEGQAHGLSFSVNKQTKIPPSLKNIFKELNSDIGIPHPLHGDLRSWAKQGVLLLNSVLSVEAKTPASHRGKGWEEFTDAIINHLNESKENLVFLLWGNDAKKKGRLVDRERHLILESAHPSPFSVRNFQGQHHFSKTNKYLISKGAAPINWEIT